METEDQSEQKEQENKAVQQVFLNVIDRMKTWQVLQSISDSSKSNSRLIIVHVVTSINALSVRHNDAQQR